MFGKVLAPSGCSGHIRNFCPCRCLLAPDQSFSTSALLTSELAVLCGGHGHYRTFSSILGLYPLNASWNNQNMFSDFANCPPGGNFPLRTLQVRTPTRATPIPRFAGRPRCCCSRLNAVCWPSRGLGPGACRSAGSRSTPGAGAFWGLAPSSPIQPAII